MEIALGKIVKDKITGFVGVAVARTEWMNNCPQWGVQPQEVKDGKPVESHWFDEPNLEVVGESGLDVLPVRRPREPVEIGDRVRDRLTTLEGVAIGITVFLNGCVRVSVKPTELKDGKPIDSTSVDEEHVVFVTRANPPTPKVETGGPRESVKAF